MIGILSQQYTLIFTGYNFAGMPIVRFNVMISEFRWKSRFSLKSSTRIGSFMNKWWASGYNRCQMVYRNTGNIRKQSWFHRSWFYEGHFNFDKYFLCRLLFIASHLIRWKSDVSAGTNSGLSGVPKSQYVTDGQKALVRRSNIALIAWRMYVFMAA